MPNPTASMLVIGDEILSGRTREANMYFLAGRLAEVAVDFIHARVVADDHDLIVTALNELRDSSDYVFTSGGIGPTHDDITADAVAAAFGVSIGVRDDALSLLQNYYEKSGTKINDARLRMARIPQGAALIENPVSIAPGFNIGNVFVMAGVPAIFQAMVESVLPGVTGGNPIRSRSFRLNMPEGEIAGPLEALANKFTTVSMGSYPFIRQGVFGSNIVLRSSDLMALEDAAQEFLQLFPSTCEET